MFAVKECAISYQGLYATKILALDNQQFHVQNTGNAFTDEASIASNITYHAEYTPSFSPLTFEVKAAYVATAQSVRDILIERWNKTYELFQSENPKQAYYLSMEFLQV